MKIRLEEINLRRFYGAAVDDFTLHYISNFDENPPPIAPLEDKGIQNAFFKVLETDMRGTPVYVCENAGQVIFHFLIRNLPRFMSDALITRALRSPRWKHEPVKIFDVEDEEED